MNRLVIPSIVALAGDGGGGGGKIENRIIIKSDTIPTASADTYKKIYIYAGKTNSTYTHGYIYECIETDAIYHLEDIRFNTAMIGFNYQGGTDPEFPVGNWTSNQEAMEAFLTLVLRNTGYTYNEAASVILTIDPSTLTDRHAMWLVEVKDNNGNTLVNNYRLYDTDLSYHGYIFLYPQEDYINADPILNTFEWVKDSATYSWVRINVQPGGTGGDVAWGDITGTLSQQTDLQNALNNKQDTLVSGTNIKTINNTSVLGSGNIEVQPVTNIVTLTTASTELATNTIYNGGELASVTLTLPATIPADFIAQVEFSSSTTATTFTAPASLYFNGDACENGVFTPIASKRYCMMIISDGINVQGFVAEK